MLIRFLVSGSVKAGPVSIHGMPGQIADLDGDDLAAALESGAVELIAGPENEKGGAKPRKAKEAK